MNYLKIYDQLIDRAKNRKLKNCYKERHHIIPISEGGKHDKNNIVELTAKEHFFAHLLLFKINPLIKTRGSALFCMCRNSLNQKRFFPSSRLYEQIRLFVSGFMSECTTGRKHIFNPNTNERKLVKKHELENYIKDGWELKFFNPQGNAFSETTWVYNKVTEKYKIIKKHELENYIKDGWIKKGRSSTKGKHWAKNRKTNEIKLIVLEDINGDWEKGHGMKTRLNKIEIYKDGEYKIIKKHELENYIKDGWIKKGKHRSGRPKKTNKWN